MPAPYPEALIVNREIQWTGGNPLQSHITGFSILPDGRIFWGCGTTLIGGFTAQKIMEGNLFLQNKVAEWPVGVNTGWFSHYDANGKLWFPDINTTRVNRFSSTPAWEAQTVPFSTVNCAPDMSFNRCSEAAGSLWFHNRNTTAADQAQTQIDLNTMAQVTTITGGTTNAPCSMSRDSLATGRFFGNRGAINVVSNFNGTVWNADVGTGVDQQFYDNVFINDVAQFPNLIYYCSRPSNKVLRVSVLPFATAGTLAVTGAVAMDTDGIYLFVADAVTPALHIVELATFTIVQTITGIISEVAAMRQWYLRYFPSPKYVVISNSNNPGSNNVTFIELEPKKRRGRRSGGELWALIPEMKDYLG